MEGADMKAVVDKDVCVGCGACVDICPEVFELDGDKAAVHADPVPPDAEKNCRDAADACPVSAITVSE
jgi:ferredoxin